MKPEITAFFDSVTGTVTYVVADPETKRAVIIDGVADYDPASGTLSHASVDRVIEFIRSAGLTVDWVLDTHVHADHLTATPYLKDALGGQSGIGEHIADIQSHWSGVFN
ncbi:MAG: MBL fold metallo-hydrolase, partial [Alphaproteobacteria bacterium HGW-Alphaproteobacteria-5]